MAVIDRVQTWQRTARAVLWTYRIEILMALTLLAWGAGLAVALAGLDA